MTALAERYDCFLLDLDGVLYRGDEPVRGAAEAVRELRRLGKRLAFVTNNSSRTPDQVSEKLNRVAVPARPDEVVSSALATASAIAGRGGGSAFVIGEAGIRTALAAAGIDVLNGEPDRADFVVVGWDRGADYRRLRRAALLVQRGALLVATNADPSYPAPDGLWPGAGALLAVITTTLGRPADEVIGKPHPALYRAALERSGGGRPLVVGDRLDTDIAGALPLGWDSLLVLTGVAKPADVVRSRAVPTYLGDDVSALGSDLPVVRPAKGQDRRHVEEVLRAAGLVHEGVEERIPETVVAALDSRIVGTASVEIFGDVAHLRSVAVEGEFRGTNLGTLLVARAASVARSRGCAELYAVTEDAAAFFQRLGFDPTGGKDALPEAIALTPIVRNQCSDGAVALELGLSPA